jgi:hypothetical protein
MSQPANQLLEKQMIVICPHCKDYILIQELNCGIFRHGVFKSNGQQIGPHEPKQLCDSYVEEKLIYGCGKPFRLTKTGEKFEIEVCEYI